MDPQTVDQGTKNRPGAVVLIAAIQFVVSALIWLPSGLLLIDDAILYHRYPHSMTVASMRTHEYYESIIGIPLCLSVIGLFTGIGLLRMRNWARRITFCMATVPALACVVYLRVHHPKGVGDALFVVGDFTPAIAWALLIVLLPVSIWWWAFFMRADIRSRFR
jgi:hypothetical protein